MPENASGSMVSNAWNNVAKPYWSGVLSSPANVLKMTGPGQLYSLWQGDHPVNAWIDQVQSDGLVAGSLDHAGNYYGGILEQTPHYQATVGNYIRYHGVFPRDESDAIRSQQFQESSGVAAGSTAILIGAGNFVPGSGMRGSRSTASATPARISLTEAPIDAAYRARLGIASSNDYSSTFFSAYPQLTGKVVVHHAVEQQALTRFPSVITGTEIHSLENLRGIPVRLNTELHLTKIRTEWNDFYRQNPTPTKQQLLQKATQIDFKYGKQFTPPVGRTGQ